MKRNHPLADDCPTGQSRAFILPAIFRLTFIRALLAAVLIAGIFIAKPARAGTPCTDACTMLNNNASIGDILACGNSYCDIYNCNNSLLGDLVQEIINNGGSDLFMLEGCVSGCDLQSAVVNQEGFATGIGYLFANTSLEICDVYNCGVVNGNEADVLQGILSNSTSFLFQLTACVGNCDLFNAIYNFEGQDAFLAAQDLLDFTSLGVCDIYECADAIGEGDDAIQGILSYNFVMLGQLTPCVGSCTLFNALYDYDDQDAFIIAQDLLFLTDVDPCDIYDCATNLGVEDDALQGIYDYDNSLLGSLDQCVDVCDLFDALFSDAGTSQLTADLLQYTSFTVCDIYGCADDAGEGTNALQAIFDDDINDLFSLQSCAQTCDLFNALVVFFGGNVQAAVGALLNNTTISACDIYACASVAQQAAVVDRLLDDFTAAFLNNTCGVPCSLTNNCISCIDGIQNGTETGIDCGGVCPPCAPTCSDGIQNGTETDVDCGGSCPACPECTTDPQCQDGQSCTDDFCVGNVCIHQTNCNDNNQCTRNDCVNGQCQFPSDCSDSPGFCCADNDPCTQDLCVNTQCQHPFGCSDNPLLCCEDNDPCTSDACVNQQCTHNNICQPTCNDGIQNGNETGVDCGGSCPACPPSCSDGIKNGTETGVDCGGNCPACPATCSDGIKNGNETGVDCGGNCPACPGCTTDANCSDGNACTIDDCHNAQCTNNPKNCSDNNSCTTDGCNNGNCTHVARNCSDNNSCTIDGCSNGNCTHSPKNCSDNNSCTIDGCSNGNCTHTPKNCSDNNSCTIDNCSNGNCTHTPKNCNDNNACTYDGCSNGNCTHSAISGCNSCSGVNCNDYNACTVDACNNGQCSHTPKNCNDNNSCTVDGCNNGNCTHTPKNCNDNNSCTTDGCNNSNCTHTPKNCNDNNACTNDGCSNGNCTHSAISGCNSCSGVNCNDYNPCTVDACNNGHCSHTPKNCNDNNSCTVDACSNGNCTHTPKNCSDNNSCTTDGCQYGNCTHTPVQGCNSCLNMNCNDNNACTIDACNNGQCSHTQAVRVVTSFTLVNSNSDNDIGPLNNNGSINLGVTPNVNLRANLCTNTGTGSVKFKVNGSTVIIENAPPFAIAGDVPTGNYRKWNVSPGTYTIEAIPYSGANAAGTIGTSKTITIKVFGSSKMEEPPATAAAEPEEDILLSAYPNPFTDVVTVSFSLPTTGRVRAEMVSIEGRFIATLFEGSATENEIYSVEFHSGSLPAGMYFYRITTGSGEMLNRKLLLVR